VKVSVVCQTPEIVAFEFKKASGWSSPWSI
jgi:hypothetical protein